MKAEAPPEARRAPPVPPPDPGLGLFETLLVVAGRPVELEAHLRRLDAGARDVYGIELPGTVAEEVLARAVGVGLGRLRSQIRPTGADGLEHRVEVETVAAATVCPDNAHGADLQSLPAEGWPGAHKWADRTWLGQAEARIGGRVPLLLDGDGAVLEASRANVFACLEGELVTPALDGRVLPGTCRAATIRLAAETGIPIREGALTVPRLRASGEVFLTSSVRGIQPARSIDGVALPGGPTTKRLAASLRRRWLGEA